MALARLSLPNWSWLWSLRPTSYRPLLPGFGAALLVFVLFPLRAFWRILQSFSFLSYNKLFRNAEQPPSTGSDAVDANGCSSLPNSVNDGSELNEDDLKELMTYIDGTDGGPPWRLMMDRSTPTMSYQAWYRDPPFGPTQYRTRTVFADLSPELIRDFFWDDEFRPKWDDMLIYFRTLDVFPETGTMIVHWIRKLPLFCNDREYVIIRRIWESEFTYYCVTKAKRKPSLPRYERPKRVDSYYSSWYVKAVESRDGGQATGSEVILFHYEDLGIQKDIVKLGVRAGMWSIVKKMDAAVQAYSMARANGVSPSSYALTASLTTMFSPSMVRHPRLGTEGGNEHRRAQKHSSKLKWLVMGGILIACGLKLQAITMGIVFKMSKQSTSTTTRKQAE